MLAVLAFCVMLVTAGAALQRARQARLLASQLRHADPQVALAALQELRTRGWLTDGTMRDVSLAYANLPEADLRWANLKGTDLRDANLRGADLRRASLHGANMKQTDLTGAIGLTDRQLAQLESLYRATMPDGQLYNGSYRLPRDLDAVPRETRKQEDHIAMAEYYGVAVSRYVLGQEWADEDLRPSIRRGELTQEHFRRETIKPGTVSVLVSVVFSTITIVLLLGTLPDGAPAAGSKQIVSEE